MSVHLRRQRHTTSDSLSPAVGDHAIDLPQQAASFPSFPLLHRHFVRPSLSTLNVPRLRLSLLLSVILCTCFVVGCIEVFHRSLFGSTLVFHREDLQRIWQWEVAHGHHPSHRPASSLSGIHSDLNRPSTADPGALPLNPDQLERRYLDLAAQSKLRSYPSRPPPGSVADLDIIFAQCDYSQGKFVKDCLSFLSAGAGLLPGKRPRSGTSPTRGAAHWTENPRYVFSVVGPRSRPSLEMPPENVTSQRKFSSDRKEYTTSNPVGKSHGVQWESLPSLGFRNRPKDHDGPCDPENPRIFHMYWTGSFNDKPYLSILSFLYTQNLGLSESSGLHACRPQLWYWINPGPAAALTSPITSEQLLDELRSNQWAAPFLHSRFAGIIQFKLWDTTERLDSIPELRHDWRGLSTIFNSGGHKFHVTYANGKYSTSSMGDYDRISTTLSDVARFVLCHQFGGIYLDTDTLFLRDWEDLWGWSGAFTYRWSYHDAYNTAVLRLNKGSAIGTFILRTALRNDFDLHPMSVSRYMKEADLGSLLYRLPDALFDSAWLNTEGLQRDRPPHPYFPSFPLFFQPGSAAGGTFDQFFTGAYSYHYHNSWSAVVDATQNQPNLGPHFWGFGQEMPSGDTSPIAAGLSWSAALKRTFEEYIRGERPNMYGEWLSW